MGDQDAITVEVVFATPEQQVLLSIEVPAKTSLQEAIRQSGMLERFTEIDLEKNKVGIFGKLRSLDELLVTGDRIEIYRALIADPKEVRRQRAAQGKVMKKGGGAANKK